MTVEAITLAYLDTFNDTNVEGVMKFIHQNCEYVTLQGQSIHGFDAIRADFDKQFKGHFGDLRFQLTSQIFDEKAQTAMIAWKCVHDLNPPSNRGLKLGMLAKIVRTFRGNTLEWSGLDLLEFKDGLIIKKSTFAKTQFPAMTAPS